MAALPEHPGSVVYIDGDSDKVVLVRLASELATQSAFAETSTGWKAIVKVVARGGAGALRYVSEYGADDELLRTTTVTVPA